MSQKLLLVCCNSFMSVIVGLGFLLHNFHPQDCTSSSLFFCFWDGVLAMLEMDLSECIVIILGRKNRQIRTATQQFQSSKPYNITWSTTRSEYRAPKATGK